MLSAIEDLNIVSPAFSHVVIPLAVIIVVGLFVLQYRGTGAMGALFGPICTLWFLTIGLLGLMEIVRQPVVLTALLPTHAFSFSVSHGLIAFVVFGSVFLAV